MRPARALPVLVVGLLLLGCASAAAGPPGTPSSSAAPSTTGSSSGASGPRAGLTLSPASSHVPGLDVLHMTGPARGWRLTDRGVLTTADGGVTWTNVLRPAEPPTQGIPPVAAFLGTDGAWVALPDGGTIDVYRTADDGATWTQSSVTVANPPDAPDAVEQPRLFRFADPDHGWLWVSPGAGGGGEEGTLLGTTDGGAHWAVLSTASPGGPPSAVPYLGIKSGLVFTSAMDGWMTIQSTFKAPAGLYATHDGGHTWKAQSFPAGLPAADIVGLHPTPANPAVAAFSVLEGRDGPLALQILPAPGPTPAWDAGQALVAHTSGFFASFADAEHGFATDGKDVFVTSDGGATWRTVKPDRSLAGVTQLDFVSATDGFALLPQVTEDVLLRTTDGGQTWSASRLPA